MKLTPQLLKQIVKEEVEKMKAQRLTEAMSTDEAGEVMDKLDVLIKSVAEQDPKAAQKLTGLKEQMAQVLRGAAGYTDVWTGASEPKKFDPSQHKRGPGITPQRQYGAGAKMEGKMTLAQIKKIIKEEMRTQKK